MIILAIIVGIIALVAILGGVFAKNGWPIAGGIVGLLIAGGLGFFSSIYTQDTGEASVVVDWTGNIQGQETTPGLHFKSPFASVNTFNIRNQNVSYIGNGQTDFNGGSAKGPSITAVDSDGVSSEVNINVRYSIRPDQVTTIYRQYKDESSFLSNYVTLTIQGAVRKVPNTYTTLDVITKQGKLQSDIQHELETAFQGSGVTIDNVSLQNVNPPQTVKDSYAQAQQAQIEVTKEKAKLQSAQVSAQQQVVQATAKAKANDVLAKSLTPPVLQQNALDTLKTLSASGNLVVVPENGTTLLNIGKK